MRRRPLASILVLTALLMGCDDSEFIQPEPQVIEETEFAPSLDVDLDAMTQTASGLYYQDLVVGEGALAEEGDLVNVRYAVFLSDGTQVQADEYEFTPGAQPPEAIEGFEEATLGMRVGGVRKAVIPPELGYGQAGAQAIPPGAVLIFDLELLTVAKDAGGGT